MNENISMNEDSNDPAEDDAVDAAAFDLAMADSAPNIPWAELKKQLGLGP